MTWCCCRLPPPPPLIGPLIRNDFLARATIYAQSRVNAPESMIIVDNYVYAGNRDGTIVEIEPGTQQSRLIHPSPAILRACGWPNSPVGTCGRPLGMRRTRDDHLLVADPYRGILKVRPPNRRTWVQRGFFDGNYRVLVSNNTLVNGKPLGYLNDVVQSQNGVVFFTSSSSRWRDPNDFMNITLEGETSGRVLVYDPNKGYPQELVTNLHFPNGVELSPNEDFLLIAEGGRSRIHRAWIGRNSPRRGTIDVFAENLPGFVDNIRRTNRGTYWVAFSRARHANLPSVLDTYGTQPAIREHIMQMPREDVMMQSPKFGIIVELDANGKIIRSLQDPSGHVYSGVSEVNEVNNVLYLGSFEKNFIGRIDLSTLPQLPLQPAGTGTSPGSGSTSGTGGTAPGTGAGTSPTQATPMTQLLDTVRQNVASLDAERLRTMVLQLVSKLVETVLQRRKEAQEMAILMARIRQMQDQITLLRQQLVTTAPPIFDMTSSAIDTTTATVTIETTTSIICVLISRLSKVCVFASTAMCLEATCAQPRHHLIVSFSL
ncbi:hypothetical protein C0Q70_13407 [Pomacea canaliculata]|uniref:Strictosidine synthase conserved region domain-containing protein n=1 Tax=Pomacea canaliculata TaxID=400727 RepID=A0A2T7NX56_POMCA|nr:hypothetical protein C0Q70_13407 [Pomacea canaliculata]